MLDEISFVRPLSVAVAFEQAKLQRVVVQRLVGVVVVCLLAAPRVRVCRFEQAKLVVRVLLEMLLSRLNNVAVIGSSSAAWDKRGRDVSG